MSTSAKSIIFLLIAFAASWSIAIGAHFAGVAPGPMTTLALLAMMAGPAIAAIVCAIAFERGRRVEALGLRFKPNWWWLAAWAIPLALTAAAMVLTIVLGGKDYVDAGQAVIAAAEAQASPQAEQLRAVPQLGLIIVAASATLAALINTPILTFTEELGWRGYLHDLWRPSGFWRASLGTGFVWGLWHAPAIYFYGLNYPANREIGIALFTLYCMLLSPIMTLVRDRAGSVWAAGVFHGTFNAVGGLTIVMISDPAFPWNGIVGVGGFAALALGVLATAILVRPRLAPKAARA